MRPHHPADRPVFFALASHYFGIAHVHVDRRKSTASESVGFCFPLLGGQRFKLRKCGLSRCERRAAQSVKPLILLAFMPNDLGD